LAQQAPQLLTNVVHQATNRAQRSGPKKSSGAIALAATMLTGAATLPWERCTKHPTSQIRRGGKNILK